MILQRGREYGFTPPQPLNEHSTFGGYNLLSIGLPEAARIEVVHGTEDGISEDIPVHLETRESTDAPVSRLDQGAKRKEDTPTESDLVSEESIPRVERVTNWLEGVPDGMAHVAPSIGSPAKLTATPETQEAPDYSSPMPSIEAWDGTMTDL